MEARTLIDDGLRDALLAVLRACGGTRQHPPAYELGVLGAASVLSLALVGLGLLSLRGAIADVNGIVTSLPPTSDPDDEKSRDRMRSAVVKEYGRLLRWRCLPGFFLAFAGTVWLSIALGLGLRWAA